MALVWGVLRLGPALAGPEVLDDSGTRVALPDFATRIVSLSAHATELIYAVGAGGALVGTAFSDYPPQARTLPQLGGAAGLDLEAIVALKPDLIVGWGSGNQASSLAALRRLGLPLYVSEPDDLEAIASSLDRIGRLTGHDREGRAAAEEFRRRLNELRSRFAERSGVSVFYQVWADPPMTLGRRHVVSRIIELCGGRNVFDDLPLLAASVEPESVLARDPQVIVASGIGEERPAWLDDWKRWPTLTAVRLDNVFVIPPDRLQRQSPRILDGAARLCAALDAARTRLKE